MDKPMFFRGLSFKLVMVLVFGATVLFSGNEAASAASRKVQLPAFSQGSLVPNELQLSKAKQFVRSHKSAKKFTCTGYPDTAGTSDTNAALALARAKAICSRLAKIKRIHSAKSIAGVLTNKNLSLSGRVVVSAKQGNGGAPRCMSGAEPWPWFNNDGVSGIDIFQDRSTGEGYYPNEFVPGEWIVGAYVWGDNPYECTTDVSGQYEYFDGSNWVEWTDSLIASLSGSTDTFVEEPFGPLRFSLEPDRYPAEYFDNTRYHFLVTTIDNQVWDYYAYPDETFGNTITVELGGLMPAGADSVIVQYSSGGGQVTDYLTDNSNSWIEITPGAGFDLNIIVPKDPSVTYSIQTTEGSVVLQNGVDTYVSPGFTGWTTTNGTLFQFDVKGSTTILLTAIGTV